MAPNDSGPEDDGFLSRWSRRKSQARTGTPTGTASAVRDETPPAAPSPSAQATLAGASATSAGSAASAAAVAGAPSSPAQAVDFTPNPTPVPTAPPPTLHDVQALGRESDYSRFVAPDVDPTVRNAALKKLFTDPHFNVMDGLDVYIDDYGKPDPLPHAMLREMVQSRALGLFQDEEAAPSAPADAQATEPTPPDALTPAPDEDPDLRLQRDDAAGRPGAEPGTGAQPGREP